MRSLIRQFLILGLAVFFGIPGVALADTNSDENARIRKEWESWNAPTPPLRIVGNVYFVGTTGLGCYLIKTTNGCILLDTGFVITVPRIEENLKTLGIGLRDIKIILNSHAHLDHAGGDTEMKRLTGAKIIMSQADAELLASGGINDFTPYSNEMKSYAPTKADRIVADGELIKLGGTTLTCHLTPGHTRGATTWTLDTTEDRRTVHVVFFSSASLLSGVKLIGNAKYPQIADDLKRSYQKWKAMPCDVFLAPHTGFFDFADKAERMRHGGQPNPFIDSTEFQKFIDRSYRNFTDQYEKAKAAGR